MFLGDHGMIGVWIIAIVGCIFGAAGAAILSRYEKGQTGFILGFLLGPIGLVIAWTMRDSQKHKEILEATGSSPLGSLKHGHRKERKCPFCAELILAEAKICKHCRSEVEPEEEWETDSGYRSSIREYQDPTASSEE